MVWTLLSPDPPPPLPSLARPLTHPLPRGVPLTSLRHRKNRSRRSKRVGYISLAARQAAKREISEHGRANSFRRNGDGRFEAGDGSGEEDEDDEEDGLPGVSIPPTPKTPTRKELAGCSRTEGGVSRGRAKNAYPHITDLDDVTPLRSRSSRAPPSTPRPVQPRFTEETVLLPSTQSRIPKASRDEIAQLFDFSTRLTVPDSVRKLPWIKTRKLWRQVILHHRQVASLVSSFDDELYRRDSTGAEDGQRGRMMNGMGVVRWVGEGDEGARKVTRNALIEAATGKQAKRWAEHDRIVRFASSSDKIRRWLETDDVVSNCSAISFATDDEDDDGDEEDEGRGKTRVVGSWKALEAWAESCRDPSRSPTPPPCTRSATPPLFRPPTPSSSRSPSPYPAYPPTTPETPLATRPSTPFHPPPILHSPSKPCPPSSRPAKKRRISGF